MATALVAASFVLSGVARANTPTPTPKVSVTNTYSDDYYSNAQVSGVADGTMRIVDDTTNNLCALIFVFNSSEQLEECCGCPFTPDQENTLSVNTDLTANPVDPAVFTADGSVVMVSSNAGYPTCDPRKAAGAKAELHGWLTHPQTGDFLTEDEFTVPSVPSAATISSLTAACAALDSVASGTAFCNCGVSDGLDAEGGTQSPS